MLNGQKSMSILTPPREDQNESCFDDIALRLHEVKFPRRKENSQPATSSESTKSSGRQSSATKNSGSPSLRNSESSTSTFKAGTFQERHKARSPNVLRKNSPFKANVSRVNESEGYEGSAEEEHPVTRGSVLLKKHEGSDKVDIEVVVDDKGTTVKVPTSLQGAENVPLPGSEQLEAPVPQRYNGQSPSEQLERVLSIHASPAASDKSPRFARYRATDPAHGFGTASTAHQIGLRPSFSPTTSEEYSFNSHSNHNNDDATPTAYNRSRYFKDPLKRISKAEDMASLQSLGQALASSTDGSGSDDHGVHHLSFQEQAAKYADLSASNSGTHSLVKAASHEMTPGRLARSSVDKFNAFNLGGVATKATPKTPSTIRHGFSNPTNPNNTPITPTPKHDLSVSPTVPLPVFKGRLNSVKSMAAKFEKPQAEKATTPTSASRLAAEPRTRAPPVVSITSSGDATGGKDPILSTDRASATPSSVLGAYTINPAPSRITTGTPVLGAYTSNTSPSPSRASMKSRNSMKSVRSITMTEAQRQRRMDISENGLGSPRRKTPAPGSAQGFRIGMHNAGMIANRIFRTSTASPNTQHRKRSENSEEELKSTSDKSTLAGTTTYGSTLALAGLGDVGNDFGSSAMLPQGDANASFAARRPSSTPRKTSMAKILPRPVELPVAQYISTRAHHDIPRNTDSPAYNSSNEVARQSVSPGSSLVSPTFFQPFVRMTSEGFAPTQQGQPGQTNVWQGRGASMLYAQVTNMQKALDAKNEENDTLKRQLATKNSLKDLGTLSQQLREAKREINAWRERALKAEAKVERLQNLHPTSVVGHGRSDQRGQVGSLLSETNDRLEQSWADVRALEEVGSVIEELTQRMSEVDGAGEVEHTAMAKAHLDTEIRMAGQDDSRSGSKPNSSSASSAFVPVSQLGSQAASASNSIFDSGSGSGSGSNSTSDSGDKTSNSNGTTIRTTMPRGGMDGVMSSEESERSEQSQGTVLRRTVKGRSTIDLMDFRSEDSGVMLVKPLMPEKSTASAHIEELAELV